ncbi:MAG: DEAD/DEAH box helicase family protein [Syntrophobacteraceae bacterium]|nr:DEAD/DEAH box helicase family protein [Syntrophobacteraceae bacterium]
MFVRTLHIRISEWIRISSEDLSPLLERKLHERLVFTNPDYELRHNRGEWIGNIAPQISCLRHKGRSYFIPRGFLGQLVDLCEKHQQPYRIVDRRRSLPSVAVEFHGELKGYQRDAAEAVLEHDFGTLVGGHKSGKTVIVLYVIAQRRQPTLILVPRLDLVEGWLNKIENFLQIPREEVGTFMGGIHRVGTQITIAHTGEAARHWRKIRDRVGFIVLDECGRCPSKVFTGLIPNFDSRYMLGVSGTTGRKDRLSRLIYYYLGDVVYTIDEKDAREGRGIIYAHIVARPTEFEFPYQSRADYPEMLQALMRDRKRTRIIADDIEAELRGQNRPLVVLSGGEEQDEVLGAELGRRGIEVVRFESVEESRMEEAEGTGLCPPMPGPSRPAAVFVSPQTLARCSQQFSTRVLFLAVPLYFRKNLADAVRDLLRNGGTPDERARIYDYVDRHIGLLENFFRMRSYNYGVHPDVLLDPGISQCHPAFSQDHHHMRDTLHFLEPAS